MDERGNRRFYEPDLSSFPKGLVRAGFAQGATDEFLVQAKDPEAQVALREILERVGIGILAYIPDGAYLVRLDQTAHAKLGAEPSVFWIGVHQPAYRIAPDLDYVIEQDEAHRLRIRARMDPEAYPTEESVRAALLTLPAVEVQEISRGRRDWIVRISGPAGVAPTSADTPTARGAANGPIMDVEDVWARGIRGEGQIAAASDTGRSTGNLATLHQDHRQQGSASNTFPATSYAGTAPKAQFVFQSVMDSGGGLGGIPSDLNNLFLPPYNDGARAHSNSWGAAVAGAYTNDSENLDEFVWNHKEMVITSTSAPRPTPTAP